MQDLFSSKRNASPTKELGVPGAVVYGGYLQSREKNSNLRDYRKFNRFEEIVSNVSIVAAAARYYVNLAASATWNVEKGDDAQSDEHQELVERMMEEIDCSWSKVVRKATMFRFNGFNLQEWTAKRTEDGMLFFDSIEDRPAWTIERWDLDDSKKVVGFAQRDPENSREIYLPRRKCVYLVDDTFSDQPDGLGVFRQVYKSATELSKLETLETIGFERDLRGSLVARIPYAALRRAVENGEITEVDAKAAISAMEQVAAMTSKSTDTTIAMDSSTYTNRSDTGIANSAVPMWNLEILKGESSGLADIANTLTRKNLEIARTMGAESLLLGADGSGSLALSKDKTQVTAMQINSTLKDIQEGFQKDLVDRFWELNSLPEEYKPKLVVSDVQSRDVEAAAAVIRDMAAAGAVLDPNDPMINEIRSDLGYSEQEKVLTDGMDNEEFV